MVKVITPKHNLYIMMTTDDDRVNCCKCQVDKADINKGKLETPLPEKDKDCPYRERLL